MVNEQHMRSLGLTAIDNRPIVTATTTYHDRCDVYDVELTIVHRSGEPFRGFHIPILARPLNSQATDGMLGRDILAGLVLTYDGPKAVCSLSF